MRWSTFCAYLRETHQHFERQRAAEERDPSLPDFKEDGFDPPSKADLDLIPEAA